MTTSTNNNGLRISNFYIQLETNNQELSIKMPGVYLNLNFDSIKQSKDMLKLVVANGLRAFGASESKIESIIESDNTKAIDYIIDSLALAMSMNKGRMYIEYSVDESGNIGIKADGESSMNLFLYISKIKELVSKLV